MQRAPGEARRRAFTKALLDWFSDASSPGPVDRLRLCVEIPSGRPHRTTCLASTEFGRASSFVSWGHTAASGNGVVVFIRPRDIRPRGVTPMPSYSLSHLADHDLLRELHSLVATDRSTTADILAHLAEVDARKLYLPAAFPSLHAYCVGELRMSADAASKRIQAARVAREFPAIFPAVADGRLHLSAVVLLAPHLSRETAAELLAAAANKSKAEIELLLVQRFPRSDVPTRTEAITTPENADEQAPGHAAPMAGPLVLETVQPSSCQHAPGHAVSPAERTKIAPLSPGKFALQGTMTQEMYDDLRYAKALLSHTPGSSDPMQVLARALREHVQTLEKRRFSASARSRSVRGLGSANPRHIPAKVRKEVWLRDGGQCAFVSAAGKRCPARERLEFDHLDLVGRRSHPSESGPPTADRIRLCCRAHNQYAAEQVYGAGFMQEKRGEARRKADEARQRTAAQEARRQVGESQKCGATEASSDQVPANEAPNPRVV